MRMSRSFVAGLFYLAGSFLFLQSAETFLQVAISVCFIAGSFLTIDAAANP